MFNWRSAQWLPVYLVGMGLIVFVSDFGPLDDPWLPLWWDMVVVAAFGLLIYYWALAVSLTTQQIEQLIGEVVIPEEEGILSGSLLARSAPPRPQRRRHLLALAPGMEHLRCDVDRGIVDHHQLEVGPALGQHARYCLVEPPRSVAHRSTTRWSARPRGRRSRGRGHAQGRRSTMGQT